MAKCFVCGGSCETGELLQSPIRELDNAIAASPYRISVNATAALRGIVATKSLHLEFCSCKKLRARIVLERSAVQLGLPFLEVLWAAAHAYIVIFDECQQAEKRGEGHVSIGGLPRTALAYSLYRELLQRHAAGQPGEWPLAELRPVRLPTPDTDAFVANELFLVAVSWLIHHEIAHARLEHKIPSASPQSEENDADRMATRWVCGDTTEAGPLHKSALGIATAVLLLVAYDLEAGRIYSDSHPPAFERLLLSLDETGLDEDSTVYAFAFKLVEIHLLQLGFTPDFGRSGTHRDKCVGVCLLVRDAAHG